MKSDINFFAVLFFAVSIFLYGVAYHNIDLSFNMNEFQTDINPFGVVRNKNNLHLIGLQAWILSIIFQFISFFLLLKIKT